MFLDIWDYFCYWEVVVVWVKSGHNALAKIRR